MSFLKLKKDELRLVAEELNLDVPEGAKIVELKCLIENSDIYKSDIELVKCVIDEVIEEKKNKIELEQIKIAESEKLLKLEEIKLLQLQKQLELANIQKDISPDSSKAIVNEDVESTNSLENYIKSVRTLTIAVPTRAESFNLYFQSLEKAFVTKAVPEKFKSEILLTLLGEKVRNLIAYMRQEDLADYEKLKEVILKQYQPTPRDCYLNFNKLQKLPSETYVQFASKLSAMYEYYLQIRGVSDFQSLCELIISDRIFNSLDRELMTHIAIKQGDEFYRPQELGRHLDLYLSSRGKTKPEVYNQQKGRYASFDKNAQNVFISEVKNVKCILCQTNGNHPLYLCPKFKNLSINDRLTVVKEHRLCFKCLSPSCRASKCRFRSCFCNKNHHQLLHFPKTNNLPSQEDRSQELNVNANIFSPRREIESSAVSNPNESRSSQSQSFAGCVQRESEITHSPFVATSVGRSNGINKHVLLSTVKCFIKNKYSKWIEIRCVLDGGSQVSLIRQDCCYRLDLKCEKINTIISALDNSKININRCVKASISNSEGSFEKELTMLVVKRIIDYTPSKILNVGVEIPNTIKLADDNFFVPGNVDILLGGEVFYELLRAEKIYLPGSQLTLQNSVFGFIATGAINDSSEAIVHCALAVEEDLNKTLQKFWEVENLEVELTKSKETAFCEEHFAKTHFRNDEGRYVVSIPLKGEPSCLGESRDVALRQLNSLWNRFSRDHEYFKLYKDFVDEYERLGHLSVVPNNDIPASVYYMPHHGVYRPDKSTTKLRVVFNCSSPTSSGVSLNDIQYNGGVIQDDLFTIMTNFRKHIYAMTADVTMMFRQILVNKEQHSLQRILWRDHANGPTKTLELNRVTYGSVSSPFLAMKTLQQLSIDEGENFPLAAPVLRECFYMDDALCGGSTLLEAKELQRQLIAILEKAGMSLHKWFGNHPELSPNEEDYDFSNLGETKTLGVIWQPLKDCFSFRITVEVDNTYTKRSVMSTIARLFDPLGLIGCVVAKAKIFMQQLWQLKLDWCDTLPEAESREWHQFLVALVSINNIKIDRCIVIDKAVAIEFHGFSDASERCYGAVVYCKSYDSSGKSTVRIVASKSRVAPLKCLTIPRLELCAAVLLSKLMKKVQTAVKLPVENTYFWTDAMIVLAWIQKEPITLKTFVRNRIAIIQELTSISQWRHVPSEQNPADLISRGLDPSKLLETELWWKGPTFLSLPESEYPNRDISVPDRLKEFDTELKNSSNQDSENQLQILNINVNDFLHKLISISNNYLTVLRILSYIFRFVRNAKNPADKLSGPISTGEVNRAEAFLLKSLQHETFPSEMRDLEFGKQVSPKSKLRSLNPFLDVNGLIRVGGRLDNSNMHDNVKHPIVLPPKHHITTLIIQYFHLKYLHVGSQTLLYLIRQKYWPLNGRNLCRYVVHNCITCVKNKPTPAQQLMGQLPKERIEPSHCFTTTGIDLSGPFYVKFKGQRKGILNKIYVVIYVCFCTKAIHLDFVSDLTSLGFIASLKRFFSRRGKASKIYTDNGRNFVGANAELKRLLKLVNTPDESLAKFYSEEKIDWHFNPPRSPNFGGLYEAGVKSFKFHLKRISGNSNFTLEEFITILAEIEGVLNSRPLTPLSAEFDNFETLTPGHFLIGRPITSIQEPHLSDINDNILGKWQRVSKTSERIWKLWKRDYLNNLQERHKWQFSKNNIKVGDLVLIKEENLPSTKWLTGRIVEVFTGSDGKVRIVNIRLPQGNVLKRSIRNVCLLPVF